MGRLVSKLGEYIFEIKYIKRKPNIVADYLSRLEAQEELKDKTLEILKFEKGKFSSPFPDYDVANTIIEKETEYPDLELAVKQDKDEYYRQMKAVIKGKSSNSF